MEILVTGGAGFIGSHICHRLIAEGYHVICLDNFDPYYSVTLKRRNIQSLLTNSKFDLVEGDICDQKLVEGILKQGIDYVFHLAAQAGVRASIENPLKTHRVNTTGLLNILTACLSTGVKRIINTSSSSVYGRVHYLPFDEVHPLNPISPYGVSKLSGEHYCQVFSELYGLNIISLRPFTVYGPRMRPDAAISIFTHKALANGTIEIFGDGSATRGFTYIDDVVEASILAMERGKSEAYNVGSSERVSINELVEKIIALTGSRSNIIHTEAIKGDVQHTWASIDKARRDLGWEPKINIDYGLEKYMAYTKQIG